jgi:hypothetical protein
MKTLLFLTADYANLTVDNKVNILGIFNQINASNFPTLIPQFTLVVKVGLEPGEERKNRKFSVYLVGPDSNKEKIKLVENIFSFPEPNYNLDPEHAIIIGLQGMVFTSPGTYQFLLHVDDRYLSSLSLYLCGSSSQIEEDKG